MVIVNVSLPILSFHVLNIQVLFIAFVTKSVFTHFLKQAALAIVVMSSSFTPYSHYLLP